jgi:hypothetical protein
MNDVNFNRTRAKITAIFSPQLVQNEMVFDKSLVTSLSIESYNNHRSFLLVMMVHHKFLWPRSPKLGPAVARLVFIRFLWVAASATGRSLAQGSPTECLCV